MFMLYLHRMHKLNSGCVEFFFKEAVYSSIPRYTKQNISSHW